MVDPAIHRPRDALHDERHDLPAVGRHRLDVRRRRRADRVVRDELVARVAVEELDLRRRIALPIRRVAQRRRRRVRVAVVRRHLRAGEDRTADRMVRDGDLAPATVVAACGEGVLAVLQARDEARETAVGSRCERARDVAAVQDDAHARGIGSRGECDGDECVAARDQVRSIRQDVDRAHAPVGGAGGARANSPSPKARRTASATRVAVVVAAVPIPGLLPIQMMWASRERNRFPDISQRPRDLTGNLTHPDTARPPGPMRDKGADA